MTNFILAIFVSGLIIGGGIFIGVSLAIWMHEKHRVKTDEMNRKAYNDARLIEIKRINAENERQLQIRRKYAELPKTPEEEQKSFEDSLKVLPYTQEEREAILKDRRRM
jgi:hypothetical protein